MTAIISRSFAGGEISPSLYSRVDQVKYATGLRTARNGVIQRDGGFTNRPGSKYVDTLVDVNHMTIPYYGSDGPLILVFAGGGDIIQFFKNGAPVTISAPAAWSNAISYVPGDLVSRLGVNYYCRTAHINQQPPNATYWHPLDGVKYSIPSPFTSPGIINKTLKFIHNYDLGREAIYSDKMTMVDGIGPIYDLKRYSDTKFVFEVWPARTVGSNDFYGGPDFLADAPTGVVNSGAPGAVAGWHVTTVMADFEESLASALTTTGTTPSAGTPVTISWSAVFGAYGYNVYRNIAGALYLVAFTRNVSHVDYGVLPGADADTDPQIDTELRYDVAITDNFPAVIGSFQQRTLLGNFLYNTNDIKASKIGYRRNFTKKFPRTDDDSLTIKLKGKRKNAIKNLVDLGVLVVFTDDGEWIIRGDQAGILKPSAAQPEQYSYNGSTDVPPLVIGSDAIYVQAEGSIIRALGFDSLAGGKDGFRDADISAWAAHLFKNKTVVSWAHQRTPHSIVWVVLDDGTVAAMTFVKEQQIMAWHRHDTDGFYMDVVSVPEGTEHATYFVVKRLIDGNYSYFLERMTAYSPADIKDNILLDCALTYDGRNTGSTTMTLSGGTVWDHNETLTLTASAVFFSNTDVGNEIHFDGSDGIPLRFEITGYTSPTVVTGKVQRTVPVAMRGVAQTTWAKAVDQLSGLDHLEGKQVAVFADGYVIKNPNNPKYGTAPTVTAGAITLSKCFSVIHVGLPFITDLETLDIDTVNGETLFDKKKYVGAVAMHVNAARGIFVGIEAKNPSDPTEGLAELKIKEDEDYNQPVSLTSDVVNVTIEGNWNSSGRVLVRQVDPVPMTILSVAPKGLFPMRG